VIAVVIAVVMVAVTSTFKPKRTQRILAEACSNLQLPSFFCASVGITFVVMPYSSL